MRSDIVEDEPVLGGFFYFEINLIYMFRMAVNVFRALLCAYWHLGFRSILLESSFLFAFMFHFSDVLIILNA